MFSCHGVEQVETGNWELNQMDAKKTTFLHRPVLSHDVSLKLKEKYTNSIAIE